MPKDLPTVTIKAPGKKPLKFKRGSLHRATGTPQGKKIPKWKRKKALAGGYGKEAKKKAILAFKGALKAGRETVARKARAKFRRKKK